MPEVYDKIINILAEKLLHAKNIATQEKIDILSNILTTLKNGDITKLEILGYKDGDVEKEKPSLISNETIESINKKIQLLKS